MTRSERITEEDDGQYQRDKFTQGDGEGHSKGTRCTSHHENTTDANVLSDGVCKKVQIHRRDLNVDHGNSHKCQRTPLLQAGDDLRKHHGEERKRKGMLCKTI